MKFFPLFKLFLACLLALFIIAFLYSRTDSYNLKCVISAKDGNRYCVRERNKLGSAANLLASVTEKMKDMVAYLNKRYPTDPRVQQLVANFNPAKICETLPTSELTAYSENKGDKIAFCLNKSKKGKYTESRLIDLNTLTFVAFHELSHLMTETIGHKQDFWGNFKFVLENAKESGIYDPVDFKMAPQEYCGIEINDSPYFDM